MTTHLLTLFTLRNLQKPLPNTRLHSSPGPAPFPSPSVSFVVFGSLLFKLPFVPKIDPYPLKFFYNMSQMMLCAYMTLEAGLVAYRNNYTIIPGNDFSTTAPAAGAVLYIFYLSKVWDFWDTIFIIIGKKWKQVRGTRVKEGGRGE
jgi:hypothetical protein